MPGETPAYNAAHSPTQTAFSYSPTHRAPNSQPNTPAPLPLHHPSYNHPHSRPPPPASPSTTGLPPIASAFSSTASKYYDPTSDHGDRTVGRSTPRFDGHYTPQQNRDSYGFPETRPPEASYDKPYHSPVANAFPHRSPLHHPQALAHPAGPMDTMSHSPVSPTVYQSMGRGAVQVPPQNYARRPSTAETPTQAPARTADPMSLSSIMSGSDPEPPASAPHPPPTAQQPPMPAKPAATTALQVKQEVFASPAPPELPMADTIVVSRQPFDQVILNGDSHYPPARNIPIPDEKEVENEVARIETTEMSDVDIPGFDEERLEYLQRGKKRSLEVEAVELEKRKRRRTAQLNRFADVFAAHRDASKAQYSSTMEQAAWQEVQNQEIAEEKERKKEMQRKRRREKTLQNEQIKLQEAIKKSQTAQTEEEREKSVREAQKAEKKAKATQQLLQGVTANHDIREVTPHAPNLEGGTMSSFQMMDDTPQLGKKRGRTGTRLKKTKEQKQAEKNAAAAAQAAIDRGDELPVIAPREEARLEALKSRSQTEDYSGPAVLTQYNSLAYQNLFNQIWKDIAKKDLPKVVRIKENSLSTKQSNLRKTAQLASKEARRWQLRTNKSMKDVQARAKRSMREMLSFWKRNERDERDQRKMAERQELENAKKAEAEREANRQKRKLNFLISQTELYSHFIGKKVKTDEVERSTDDVAVAAQTAISANPNAPTVTLPDADANAKIGKVTNFEDLDFDAEDESVLHAAAMANAQNAVQEAQDRARAFNGEDQSNQMQDFDEGEMNFQNPTSLQSMDITQPALLNCTLKEYQLKGLNWLVNLYEQGINGILADEMGLGKTVQSISVMAYLAETHNIWGPFLVIAPASTLHNWQQEIARFVPNLKVLPYWGNAKDRKILRKFWDRKHITYSKDSSFHVLVTSYQLVVQDAQYFQKIRWQYMILDEAQAIKSSQSSRWKSLLGFHCRNRLLLTGTPIQNNMQELWALLHFIMPSLFDSHDEFSDWFSKDIESHAQSNTKLNEDQLKRLHMILKPFMLRRIKKHVQKELGDKIELDVFCDLTYRQRAYYSGLRNKISIMDLIEKVVGDDQDSSTLMNLVMQFRKVCNHPDLFERADTNSPLSFASFAETASFMREGQNINVSYSVRNLIEIRMPKLVCRNGGRLDIPGPENSRAGFKEQYLYNLMNVWNPNNIHESSRQAGAFSWLRFADVSANEASAIAKKDIFQRAIEQHQQPQHRGRLGVVFDGDDDSVFEPKRSMLNIVGREDRVPLAEITAEGHMYNLLNISKAAFEETGLDNIDRCSRPSVSAPPIELYCASHGAIAEKQRHFFNVPMRKALYGVSEKSEQAIIQSKVDPAVMPATSMLPPPTNRKGRFTDIEVPSMRRFVTDSGKLAKLDALLKELKKGDHRVLLYFQMTRMIDLMEEYLTYRNYKYCRLDGSTKLEDRRDTVADFQSRPDIFIFLLSTRAGGLGINLTAADTVIFYDSDWNPTIDSQAMDRAHRLGQTRQVTVYRLITRGTIEERIRKRALQKEEVQRVVISGGAGAQVDFNTRSRENRTKDIAMWLADDDQAAEIEKKEAELAAAEAAAPPGKKRKNAKKRADVSLDDMYHEGEGNFADDSAKPSGTATPVSAIEGAPKRKGKGMSKKAKTLKQRLAIADGQTDHAASTM
ncbi:helicase SWR1 [Mytilinidion resinicola]|uniref:Chromatin-remodeling ATPase INO80 n=1 Tax=Mytilinidion resinicola TaxID=574789 RepID=A0A6A6YSI0_9PEZI|nr:helicase SWR1 [Mytilinidion resinicola]KAF2810925.1 helicase SWR1 [Mytilinidion resinicola]